ncbi:MAG: hypothetical protein HY812_20930 [Planctomycetes bacterium]|nr:hypothetical protein [Planctomycetota bacterium]
METRGRDTAAGQTVLAESSPPRSRREEEVNSAEFLTTSNEEIGDEGRPGADPW